MCRSMLCQSEGAMENMETNVIWNLQGRSLISLGFVISVQFPTACPVHFAQAEVNKVEEGTAANVYSTRCSA